MEGSIMAIVVGIAAGLGGVMMMRRYMKPQPKAPVRPPPANRQQARKQQREVGKKGW